MFKKNDSGKPSVLSLSPFIQQLGQVSSVVDFGANKYGDKNWQTCTQPERYLNAAMRHILAIGEGEWYDKESKKPHLAHAICSLLMAWWVTDNK